MQASLLVVKGRRIGSEEPVFVIAEASINHNGSIERAKELIDAAVSAGADAVKFQKRNLAEVYQRRVLDDPNSAEQKYQYLIPLLKEFELPDKAFIELAEYAKRQGIIFMVNGWDKKSVRWIEDNLDMPVHKVGSPDMTNDELLEAIAGVGKPMIVSTGMSSEAEVSHAVQLLRKFKVKFALLHTNNTYPAPFEEINLRYMDKLRDFQVPVGYSGHERGIAVSIAAVGRGACIIERHISVDRSLPGPDHNASLDLAEFKQLVQGIRQTEKAVGTGVKRMSRAEAMNREILAKSIVAAKFIADGTMITRDMLTTKSPAKGVSPQRMGEVVGRSAPRDIPAGEPITEDDLTTDQILESFTGQGIAWKWGPIVRLREDFNRYLKYSPGVFEFHLSDKDLEEEVPRGKYSQQVVVHVPEYRHRLYLDPASEDEEERKIAIDTLQRSINVARKLGESFAGTPKLVVHPCGITLQPHSKPGKLLDIFADTLDKLDSGGVEILPENMPPRPWVFGGEWFGNIFLLAEEIKEFLDRYNYKMCFDTSHAVLASNDKGGDLAEMVKSLQPYIRHLHVSDGAGIGDEGMQIGEGVIDFERVLAPLVGYKHTMVPEIWQGHLHGGKGFLQAMIHLEKYMK